MTTSPIATRRDGRFATEDVAGPQQTLGLVRAGWPVELTRLGTGPATVEDSVQWDAQAAIVLDAAISIVKDPADAQLAGGTLLLEVNVAGQSAYSGADGWMAVVPEIEWLAGADPLFLSGALGKAHVLTKAGDQGARIRITSSSADWVRVVAMVAPVVANPACVAGP